MAQDEIDQIIKGGVEDANYLVGGYINPFLQAIGGGLNQGWYNTAKPHKPAGLDITVSIAAMQIPDADKSYTVKSSEMESLNVISGSGGQDQTATIFGADDVAQYQEKSGLSPAFFGPEGIDPKGTYKLNALPVPVAHLGIGLPKGIELKIRYIPTINLGDEGKLNLFGIGVMHDVKQYIPGIKNLPFDLSGFVGYTKFKTEVEFNSSGDQKGIFEAKATTIQGVISKKIAVLTFYGGLGYNIAKTTFKAVGDYDFDGTVIKDPVDASAKSSGPRISAGMRLKLAILTIHGDYTLQKYKSLTVGIGLSVR
jgi:hypothetical protein